VGCTTGSREEVPGERKPVVRDADDDYYYYIIIIISIARTFLSSYYSKKYLM
jgi:hypothetical protein